MGFEVFSVTPDMLPRFERVSEDVFDEDIDTARLSTFIADPSHHMVCAAAGDMVIGQARGLVVLNPDGPPSLYIDNLGITPAWFRQGVATRLLDRLFAWGASRGARATWVLTETCNEGAIDLYKRHGLHPRKVMICERPP
ncbi:MAG: GNAT family N-acetyltransferase [Pseudomonadota bacterium]